MNKTAQESAKTEANICFRLGNIYGSYIFFMFIFLSQAWNVSIPADHEGRPRFQVSRGTRQPSQVPPVLVCAGDGPDW